MKKADVILYFGTQEKTARALNISQVSVSKWTDSIPPLRAYEIERLTKGKLVAEFGPESKNK